MKTEQMEELLARQVEVMGEFGERQQELQDAIVAKDWPMIDSLVPRMERLSREASELDERRHALFARAKRKAGLQPEATFGELLEHVPHNERRTLAALFRSLQVAVLKVKSVTRGIDSYVRGSLRSTNELLGAVYPDQKGTIYCRRGRRSPADGRAMVLDRKL
jgi:predicted transcriptional regulator